MNETTDKYEIAGCPVSQEVYLFLEGVAAANGMNLSTFTAWSMTQWAEKAMKNTANRMGMNNAGNNAPPKAVAVD